MNWKLILLKKLLAKLFPNLYLPSGEGLLFNQSQEQVDRDVHKIVLTLGQ
jgi:hypothetical protein